MTNNQDPQDDQLTKDIYAAMQIPYLSERHDAIKAIIDRTVAERVLAMNNKVDRLEVIDGTGRAYVKGSIYGSPIKLELSYQDNGRTLKVFVSAAVQEGEK